MQQKMKHFANFLVDIDIYVYRPITVAANENHANNVTETERQTDWGEEKRTEKNTMVAVFRFFASFSFLLYYKKKTVRFNTKTSRCTHE